MERAAETLVSFRACMARRVMVQYSHKHGRHRFYHGTIIKTMHRYKTGMIVVMRFDDNKRKCTKVHLPYKELGKTWRLVLPT